jgi:IS4 transposase
MFNSSAGLNLSRFQGADEMVLSEVFDRFVQQSPVTVMVRATMENVFSTDRLDKLFAKTAQRQRPSDVLFSLLANLMGSVVSGVRPSVHAAVQARKDEIDVSMRAIYGKLQGIEPCVSRELVRETADRMARIIDPMGNRLPMWVSGYQVKILDGNHLPRSERRLKELRSLNAAPLPGKTLVVLDPLRMLAIDAFPCEDGHAQERSLLPQVLQTVEKEDLWIADRNFCTMGFLGGIAQRNGYFAIRQHSQNLRWELVGRRKKVGRIETGVVYEQEMRLLPEEGEPWSIRRVTVKLDQPTRDGDGEIHILTNLPKKVRAQKVARLYRRRWTVETAFQELEAALASELQTLAYPAAALFAFCMALVSYNILSVVKAALRAVHGADKIQEEVSGYYLADEVAGTWRGMMIVLPAEFWHERFDTLTAPQMASFLVDMAQHVRLSRFKKHRRGPKKPPDSKMNKTKRAHVSTARILKQRKPNSKVN